MIRTTAKDFMTFLSPTLRALRHIEISRWLENTRKVFTDAVFAINSRGSSYATLFQRDTARNTLAPLVTLSDSLLIWPTQALTHCNLISANHILATLIPPHLSPLTPKVSAPNQSLKR